MLLALGGCATQPQQAAAPPEPCTQVGLASWYRPAAQPRTASGERPAPNALTAAHKSLPFGTQLLVTDVSSGRSVVVRVSDRGPFAKGRVIDLSAAAAKSLGIREDGVAQVRLEFQHQDTANGGEPASGDSCPFNQTVKW